MKSNYVIRARKFMMSFIPYMKKYRHIEDAVNAYNLSTHRHVEYHYGMVRRCLVLSDYAVKWDYNVYGVKTFGGCEQEMKNYQLARAYGYEYLFAEITPIDVNGEIYYVMPRVRHLGIEFGDYAPDSYLSYSEEDFIYNTMHLGDLHDENWGLVNGEVKIIDYACCDGGV